MAGVTDPLLDESIALWEVHEQPERELDPGAMICSCATCEASLLAQARRTPRRAIGLATASDRIVVSLEYLAQVLAVDRSLAPLLYVTDDWVRYLFVPTRPWIARNARWWSMACAEDEATGGRRHPRHRVAKRQSQANRVRSQARHEPDADTAPSEPPVFVPLATAVAESRGRHRGFRADVDDDEAVPCAAIAADMSSDRPRDLEGEQSCA